MIIKKIEIENFGKFSGRSISFEPGFNMIFGKNEDGKSTLMAFIKMMFYGNEGKSTSIAKNIRKKYTPWDGSPMAGSIDFECENKKYRLEKEFRTSNSTDKTTLVDLSLGSRQSVPSDIGNKFFGLTLPAFERSVFIGQFGFPESDTAAVSELNAKLSNIAFTGDESVSFNGVYSKLEKARHALMSKGGKAGIYDKNIIAIKEMEAKLLDAEEKRNNITKAKETATNQAKEIELLHKRILTIKEQVAFEGEAQKGEKLTEYLETKKQLDNLNENLKLKDGNLIDEMYLRSLKFCISKLTSAENAVREKENQVKIIEQSLKSSGDLGDATPETKLQLEQEIQKLESLQKENSEKAKSLEESINSMTHVAEKFSNCKSRGIFCLISGILLAIFAAVAVILKFIIPAAISGIIGVCLITLGIIFLGNSSKLNKLSDEIKKSKENLTQLKSNDLSSEIFDKRVKLEAVTNAINAGASVIEKQKELLKETNLELAQLLKTAQAETNEVIKIFERYKAFTNFDDMNTDLEEISQICINQKEIKNKLNFIAKDLGNISYTEAAHKLEEIKKHPIDCNIDFTELKKELDNSQNILGEKRSELSALLAEIKAAEKVAENPEIIKSEIETLSKKTASQKRFCDACELAMEILNDSYAQLRSGFGSVLESSASKILSELTNNKYDSMTVSDTFDIGVTQKGVFGNREVGYLSSGTADQTYLSLRLALSSLMNNEEKLPVLLDDALAQYDDQRLLTALEFLNDYSENNQTILFTCHKQISEFAENLGAVSKTLK